MARLRIAVTDAEYLLTEWGIWVRSGGVLPRYQSPAWMIMRDNVGGGVRSAMIEDSVGVMIDGMVARLGQASSQKADALMLYYVANLNYRELGRRLGIPKDAAAALVVSGVNWVDGALAFAGDV